MHLIISINNTDPDGPPEYFSLWSGEGDLRLLQCTVPSRLASDGDFALHRSLIGAEHAVATYESGYRRGHR